MLSQIIWPISHVVFEVLPANPIQAWTRCLVKRIPSQFSIQCARRFGDRPRSAGWLVAGVGVQAKISG